MSNQSKGARLYLKPASRPSGEARWVIRDGTQTISTGFSARDRALAERRLAQYLTEKHKPSRGCRGIEEISVADVINIYLRDVAPGQANPAKAADRAENLLRFFGERTLSEINGSLCRAYAAWRGSEGAARRELQDFAAAINHHHKEGLHREVVKVVLPPAGSPRLRWLTRSEVARLLWACLATRETQGAVKTDRRPLRHLARFILVGVYTGSRPGAILGLSWHQQIGRGYVDQDNGMIYRRAEGARETNKRQPPVPMAPRLLAHMRRWARIDGGFGPVVRWQGASVLSVKTGLNRAVKIAGLDTAVTAYTLRHTAASWLVQQGVSTRKVADFLGTGEEMVNRHYGHMSPDHLRDVADQIGRSENRRSNPACLQPVSLSKYS